MSLLYVRLFFLVSDHLGFRPFRALTDVKKRYLSLSWTLAPWQDADILAALLDFIGSYHLTGIELGLNNIKQAYKFIAFCEIFVSKAPAEDSLMIRVDKAVDMTEDLLGKLSRLSTFLILETQAARMGALHTLRFPNPYQPYNGSHRRDVYLRYRLWNVHAWKTRLRADNVCFSISLTVIKGLKGARPGLLGYSYTNLKEACRLHKMQTGVEWMALSRYKQNRTVFYGYDNKKTITKKLWRVSHEFPNYCVSVYDVENDDFEGFCPNKSTPLLRIIRKLVTPITHSRFMLI
ncbi:uncharacterized protein LOC8036981 [Ixodes scapularis]|nr:uncharacterized protein LOC8036981 [Ixodes scapularis]